MYIYSPELYPTNIRSLAVKTFLLLNRAAAGLVPFFIAFFSNLTFIIGILCAIAVIVIWQLPESNDIKPGDEVEELKDQNEAFLSNNLSRSGESVSGSIYLDDINRLLKSS